MALDPSIFSNTSIADTCSVWNILSSCKIFRAAINAPIYFCISEMVLYECLHKPRTSMEQKKTELINRLETALKDDIFPVQICHLDDLVHITQMAPRGLGSGEMSCIAIAYHIRNISFMTDEKKARSFASNKLGLCVETTPKLYAWLHFYRHLTDGDHHDVIKEHESFEDRPLTIFLNEAYEEAQRCRLMQKTP